MILYYHAVCTTAKTKLVILCLSLQVYIVYIISRMLSLYC